MQREGSFFHSCSFVRHVTVNTFTRLTLADDFSACLPVLGFTSPGMGMTAKLVLCPGIISDLVGIRLGERSVCAVFPLYQYYPECSFSMLLLGNNDQM